MTPVRRIGPPRSRVSYLTLPFPHQTRAAKRAILSKYYDNKLYFLCNERR